HGQAVATLDLQLDLQPAGRPQPKARPVGREQGRAERQVAGERRHLPSTFRLLRVRPTLRAPTTISSTSRSRSSASGLALFSTSRVGSPGGGRRKRWSSPVALKKAVRIEIPPSPLRLARRNTRRCSSGLFHESLETCSP